jgi:hypothetical protein
MDRLPPREEPRFTRIRMIRLVVCIELDQETHSGSGMEVERGTEQQ